MATDGVKIIDGDSAHDIYTTFERMYNNGATVEMLKEQYETDKKLYKFSDEEYEVCITVYALAFWEIGALSDELLAEVENVIRRKATVIGWTEEVGKRAGKARQQELDKFIKKISTPKTSPRKRKIESRPIIDPEQQQLIESAAKKAVQGQYTEAAIIYEQLLAQNPRLHDARYNYIEMIYDMPIKTAVCPPYKRGCDLFGSEKHLVYAKYIVAHTDWSSIEKHCRYMLANRNPDRMEVSDKQKKEICEWYLKIISSISNALQAQQKYAEAIPFIQEGIDFTLSRKGVKNYWVINEYTAIHRCLMMMGNRQQTDSFIQKFMALFPDSNKVLELNKRYVEQYGIEAYLVV